jgi:hypothetical protein
VNIAERDALARRHIRYRQLAIREMARDVSLDRAQASRLHAAIFGCGDRVGICADDERDQVVDVRGDCASEDLRLIGDVSAYAAEILRQQPQRRGSTRHEPQQRSIEIGRKQRQGFPRNAQPEKQHRRWAVDNETLFGAREENRIAVVEDKLSSALVDDAPPGQIHPEKDIVADKRVIRSCDLPKTAKRALEDAESGEAYLSDLDPRQMVWQRLETHNPPLAQTLQRCGPSFRRKRG